MVWLGGGVGSGTYQQVINTYRYIYMLICGFQYVAGVCEISGQNVQNGQKPVA